MLSSLRRAPAKAKGRSRALGPLPRLAAHLAAAAVAWLAAFGGTPRATALPETTGSPASLPTATESTGSIADLGDLVPADAPPIPGLPELGYDLERLQQDFDIPIEINDRVLRHLREYQSPGSRRGFLRWIASSHRYAERFREILQEHGVPGDLIFLAMVESGFRTHAESPAGAVGPWQFMASTGRELGLRTDRWVDERRDPEKSARAAARFLWLLHERMGDWHLAWAAYNAGPGRVSRALRRGYSDFWHMEQQRALPVETRDYVAKIIAAAILTRHAEAFGLPMDQLQPGVWVDYELVLIPRSTSLSQLASLAGVSVRELRELNPELRRSVTPPRPYLFKIPRANLATFAERWPGTRPRSLSSAARERVAGSAIGRAGRVTR